jgi:S1-C subfamily serine protease
MATVLSDLSDEIAETVSAAGDSVVRVEARSRLPASGFVWSAEGVIVTANHVVERDENIEVGLPDGHTVAAEIAGRDPTTDLAVLRAQAIGLKTPGWTDPDGVRVGNIALALGRPGRTVQATLGIVSALGEGWRTRAGGQIDRYLQTDLVMYPGFSGGPLVDASGSVVGLNSSALLRGVTVSVPVATVRGVVETLLEHGRIRRGYLGVGFQVVRLPEGLELEQETGLLVASVQQGSAADDAGLLLGDTIVSLSGKPVRHPDDLLALLTGESVGTSAPVRIVRGGVVQELEVTIGERGSEHSDERVGEHERGHGGRGGPHAAESGPRPGRRARRGRR